TQRDLVEKPEVRRLVESAVNEVNRQVDDEEQIQGFELLPVDLEETGALTATQKVRRGVAAAQVSALIERMYAARRSSSHSRLTVWPWARSTRSSPSDSSSSSAPPASSTLPRAAW